MESRKSGKTVLFSSHELYELERVADMVCMIYQGRVMVEGWVRELLSHNSEGMVVEAEVLRPTLVSQSMIRSVEGIQDFDLDGSTLRVQLAKDVDGRERLSEELVKSGAGLVGLRVVSRTLEDLFMEVVRKGVKS